MGKGPDKIKMKAKTRQSDSISLLGKLKKSGVFIFILSNSRCANYSLSTALHKNTLENIETPKLRLRQRRDRKEPVRCGAAVGAAAAGPAATCSHVLSTVLLRARARLHFVYVLIS